MVYGRYIYSFHAGDRQTFHWGAPSCGDWHFTNTYMFLQCQDVLIHVFVYFGCFEGQDISSSTNFHTALQGIWRWKHGQIKVDRALKFPLHI